MAHRVEVAVEVAAPAEVTWAVLTDWERQSEWFVMTQTQSLGPTGGHAVGEEIHGYTGIGRLGFLDTMVIEDWDPPYRCTVRKTGRVVRGGAEFVVEPLPRERCRVIYRIDPQLPFGRLGSLGWPLVREVTAAFFRRSLSNLARLVETEYAVARPRPGT
jgi:carbon monoxide dehydrogenase subunit G